MKMRIAILSRMRAYEVLTTVLGWIVLSTTAIAAGAVPQSPFKPPSNLRVLSNDAKLADIIPMMKGFTQALGVRCQFCHSYTGSDPNALENFDFAGDAVPAKTTARTMMAAVQAINRDLLKDVGAAAPSGEPKVTCYTCHRGERTPQTVPGPAR